MQASSDDATKAGIERRHLLVGGLVGGGGALLAGGTLAAFTALTSDKQREEVSYNGVKTEPFYGLQQAGIETIPQAHASFVAYDLHPGKGRDELAKMLKLLSDDAAALTQGSPALADMEGELAVAPARLTVTFGFGPGFFRHLGQEVPKQLGALPSFSIDRLQAEYSDGDFLVQICCDDPLTLSHAARICHKDLRHFAQRRWVQTGFRRAYGTENPQNTMRNLFGQLDGTANPRADDMQRVVWGESGSWAQRGTTLVLRRISMDLDRWDRLDRSGREEALGRTLAHGAPLSGTQESDPPDFAAKNAIGFPRIADYSHIRRAHSSNARERIFRRGYNYEEASGDAGLLFASYQADVGQQFLPIQRRLAELDLLNQWVTPVGSALFAIPPGCSEGGYVGDWLFQ